MCVPWYQFNSIPSLPWFRAEVYLSPTPLRAPARSKLRPSGTPRASQKTVVRFDGVQICRFRASWMSLRASLEREISSTELYIYKKGDLLNAVGQWDLLKGAFDKQGDILNVFEQEISSNDLLIIRLPESDIT